MSNRERWIVYPLLFLALGAALFDKIYKRPDLRPVQSRQVTAADIDAGTVRGQQAEFESLQCKEFAVMGGPEGKTRVVRIRSNPETHDGAIIVFDSAGDVKVLIDSAEGGGVVRTMNNIQKNLVVVEHHDGTGVISIYNAEDERFVVIPAGPIKTPGAPEPDPPKEQQPTGEQPAQPETEQPPSDEQPPTTAPNESAAPANTSETPTP